MSEASSKHFGPIRDDYAFFQKHSTEAQEDLRAYAPRVRSLSTEDKVVRMLDFGCGDGVFTTKFLARSRLTRERLRLSLVEPDDVYRQQAVARLQAFSADPVPAWPALPPHLDACFDLILSNHVFYYVPDLEDTLSAVLSSLSPSGLFLASMAGLSNTMVQFCIRCFGLIGKPYPFRTSEDFEVAMDRLGRSCAREDIHYELVFPDSEENRLEIARFLMGSDYPAVPTQVMVDLFAPYSSGGRIAMQLVHKHFAVGDWGSAEMPATVAGRQ